MKAFAELIRTLDATNKTNAKVAALAGYFETAPDRDKVWTIAILSHRRPPRPVNTGLLREWAAELAGIPMWLFEESYHIVGDLAETIALIVPSPKSPEVPDKSLTEYLEDIIRLRKMEEAGKKSYLLEAWAELPYYPRFVLTKLMTGGFRIGISQKLMTRALAKATGQEEDLLAHKLMGQWDPAVISFEDLVLRTRESDLLSRPYPFYLAYGLEGDPADLGNPEPWVMEHKWDGIRAQLIQRKGNLFLWSRGEELITHTFPELERLAEILPDGTVLDGEILPFPKGQIGSFRDLQKRLGRKTVSASMLAKIPVILRAYDLLEWQGEDIRDRAYSERRKLLEKLLAPLADSPEIPLDLSHQMNISDWAQAATTRQEAREVRSEGLMLKRKDAPYGVGRKKGDWWKWKVDPLTVDAVLTYAMRGHGRRSNLFTDYTFALWDEKEDGSRELVTFAKAYSGLTDAEFREVDAWIKRNTLERFGPVRSVTPLHVFEIAFEGIARSSRHKSGVATRFPRIVRWRKDKPMEEADTLQGVIELIPET
ncbi:DNA ligase-1 [Robiginitalea myxolifaciens]|uniref:DNA ligase (ATP) n=1 Tax=Robiginitalea myxolifaciens TaxID=400055 RepID=A0A1I6FWZ9_9FLAO|nr:ATP-dependent DNA ligase [Robiginitalea myxolifaciens]SFR34473.1 DNA ligase-1 [Robiginitalea myxolifaciens]